MPKAPKARGFYAVAKGHTPGVYETWDECEAQVTGFQGARHKKFTTVSDAEDWIRNSNPGVVIDPENIPSTSTTAPAAPRYQSLQTGRGAKNKERDWSDNVEVSSREGWLVVYCDGACKSNGKKNPVAGLGVYFGPRHAKNLAERCPGKQTNNCAELTAIARVLETAPKSKTPMEIRTDSTYCMNCLTKYMPKWRRNGFKTSAGEPVKNGPLLRYVDALLKARAHIGQKVEFQHVAGHSGEPGNDAADALANQGCLLPDVVEPDWAALEQDAIDDMKYWDAEEFEDEIISSIDAPPQVQQPEASTPTAFAVVAARARTVTPPGPTPALVQPATPDRPLFRPSQGAAAAATRPDASLREEAVQTLEWVHAPGCVPPDPSLGSAPAPVDSTAAAGSGPGQSSRTAPPQLHSQQRTQPEPQAGVRQKAAAPVLTQAELDEYGQFMLNTQELAAEISPPLSQAQVHSQTESQKQQPTIRPAPVVLAPSPSQPTLKGKQKTPAALAREPSNEYAQYMLTAEELRLEMEAADAE